MKFALALLAVVCLFGLTYALPDQRNKRAVDTLPCPMDVLCQTAIDDMQKMATSCLKYELSGNNIIKTSCGVVQCPDNSKLGKEDLSKPYPDCCAKCE